MVIVENNCAGFSQQFYSKEHTDFKKRLEDIEHKVKVWNSLGGKHKQYNIVKIEQNNATYYYDKMKNGVGLVFTIYEI